MPVTPPSTAPKRQQPIQNSPATNEKRQLVQRILSSQGFSRSVALRSFLLHITESAINGQTEKLKEQAIGVEVLGRRPDYDPAVDNIVRVRARELRERLAKYYETEGVEESIVITIPKGSYVPEFEERQIEAVETTTPLVAEPPIIPAHEPRPLDRIRLLLVSVIVALLSIVTILTFYLWKFEHRQNDVTSSVPIRDFWGQLFLKPDDELRIVYADSSLALWQDISGRNIDLGSYLSHNYAQAESDKFREVATRTSTSIADLSISVSLAKLAGAFQGRLSAIFARDANIGSLDHDNIFLIGSRRSNPWVDVYEHDLNWQLAQDPVSGAPLYVNHAPQSSEAAQYAIPDSLAVKADEQKSYVSYGIVALLKVCGQQNFIILAQGLNTSATQAAGDLITNPERLEVLLRSIGHKPGSNVAPFEALFQITSLSGPVGYDNPKVIAFRDKSAESCVRR
jgi:hypothetical protein